MTQMALDIFPEQLTRKHPVHTGKNGYEHYRRTFVSLFKETARNHHRYEVFRDFAEMAALAMQNAFLKSPTLEKEYLAIAGRYKPDDIQRMTRLLGCLAGALECQYGDFLGQIFMELDIGSEHMGQFFSPYDLSQLMASVTAGDVAQQLEREPFIMLDEPAVGAGSMVIAFAEVMMEQGINPQQALFARCTDIDPIAAHMCYLQLSYLGIPAEVIIGNTLTLVVRKTFKTPLWYVGNWGERLGTRDAIDRLRRFLKN
ncbi:MULTISPECIES: N-6 DNA methylase [unclassified Serratia (in: enterobacteria)]|uniref:N-6 DNA methylase n=1 Tax=unclassified Serratia (in: enterobacteria) TaxID=2647522 RepID=UPI00307614D0